MDVYMTKIIHAVLIAAAGCDHLSPLVRRHYNLLSTILHMSCLKNNYHFVVMSLPDISWHIFFETSTSFEDRRREYTSEASCNSHESKVRVVQLKKLMKERVQASWCTL